MIKIKFIKYPKNNYDEFISILVTEYTKSLLTAQQYYSKKEAENYAFQAMTELFPNKLNTSNQYVYSIQREQDHKNIGLIWYSINDKKAHIEYIYIDENFRRNGYAKQAMEMVEAKLAKIGVQTVELHVYAFKEGAKKLYDKLNYIIKNQITTGQSIRYEMGKTLKNNL